MDKLTFCNNYLYSCGQVIFIFVDKLSPNYWVLKLVTGVKCSSVTNFKARYQYGVISNGLKQPVTNRALISN
jgi:hypothetical protein